MTFYGIDFDKGSVGIVVGICVAVLTTSVSIWISRRKFKIRFYFEVLKLIGSEDAELNNKIEILYDGTKVRKIVKTSVIICNTGNLHVDRSHLVDKDRLRLEFDKDVTILSSDLVSSSNNSCGFSVTHTEGDNIVYFDFDYLNPRDAVRVEILNTGGGKLNFCGSLKGTATGIKCEGRISKISLNLSWGPVSFGIVTFLVIFLNYISTVDNLKSITRWIFIITDLTSIEMINELIFILLFSAINIALTYAILYVLLLLKKRRYRHIIAVI